MSSLTEIDISENSDSTSYIYFLEANNSLQHYFQFLCDREGSWECQSYFSSYYSTSEIWLQEEAAHVQLDLGLMAEERPLYAYQTQISLESLQEHANPSLFVEDEKDEQSCNQSQRMKKPAVCHEGLNHKEEEEDSKWDFLYVFQIHKLFCLILLKNTMIFPLKHLE